MSDIKQIDFKRLGFLLTIIAFIMASITPSFAKISPNSSTNSYRPIIERFSTSAPLGFQIFCVKNPRECRSSSRKKIGYSKSLMRLASQVNSRVNRSIRARNDRGADVWTLNTRVGDCEDFVLAKRAMLIKAGVPSGALRIATATTRRGVGHAVLVIRTNRGDFVLDNRMSSIKLWNKTDLRMIAMSGANPKRWKKIS